MDYKKLQKQELIDICEERKLSYSLDWEVDILVKILEEDDKITKDWMLMMKKLKEK